MWLPATTIGSAVAGTFCAPNLQRSVVSGRGAVVPATATAWAVGHGPSS